MKMSMIKPIYLLLRNNRLMILNQMRGIRRQSRLKVVFICVFAAIIAAAMFLLFKSGFRFLSTLGGVGLMIIDPLFALFFFGLGVMLVLSNVVTSFALMYRSEETPFLLLRPVSRGEVAVHKFLESAAMSSWSFFFIIIPFVAAYAWQERMPLYFTLWTLLFSIPYVLLFSAFGVLLTLAGMRWLPRGGWRIAAGAAVLAALSVIALRISGVGVRLADETAFIMTRIVPGLKLASYPLWPSWWVSEGIQSLSRGDWLRGGMFLCLLVSSVLLILVVIELLGGAVFYESWLRNVGGARSRVRRPILFGFLDRSLAFLPSDVRAMALKDIRVLCRDSVQWTQGLIFFGLLGLYFLNLRNLDYHMLNPVWQNLLAFLNVFSLSAIMCSFCSRFVYPQLSLEGQAFWIIGVSPSTLARAMMTKLAFSALGMSAISGLLTLISTGMLRVPPAVFWSGMGLAFALAIGLSGLSTGLGAAFIDLRQRNPMAIVSGFGGTLNLLLSLGYIVGAILPFAMIFHWNALKALSGGMFTRGLAIAAAWLAAMTILAVFIPILIGLRNLRHREY